MNSGRQHADRLASRLAFMNAENDRLKKIIMDYERRFAGDATSGRSNLDIEDCSDDSQPLSMGVGKRQDRGRLGAKQSNPQDSRVIASLKQQLEKVQSDYQRAMNENHQLKRQFSFGPEKENRSPSYNEPTEKEYLQVIKHMKAEIQQLQDTVRLLREERKQMISQEQHFEKLREHEVLFLESLRLAESRSRNDFKDSKRNSLGFNNEGSRRGTIPQSPSDFGLMSSSKMPISWHHEDSLGEEEVKNQMQGLEKKIDELIQENESILRENQDLKDLSLSIINSTRKVNSCCFCGNYQYSSNKPGLESKASTKEETFSSRDREIVDLVQSIEDRFRDERKELKERVVYLEEEMSKLRKNRTAEQSAAKRPIANGEFHGELDEAYSTIDRLEKENRLLLTRIDQLSAESSRNREDTGLLYSIIEQKNKAQNELLRERSLDLAQNSYRSHDNGG